MGVSGASIPPSRAASEHSPIMAPRALVGNSSIEYVTPPVKHTATITLPIRKNAILAQLIPGMEMQSKEPATKKHFTFGPSLPVFKAVPLRTSQVLTLQCPV